MTAPESGRPKVTLPPRPRLVLRVGFAGRRELASDEQVRLEIGLHAVLQALGRRLAAIAPNVKVESGNEPRVSAFYARECPLLRLVTGLCEGADAVAAEVLGRVRITPDGTPPPDAGAHCLETELAAVVPFDVETYRRSRPPAFQAEFDSQLARCAWVVALDGIYDKPDPDTAAAKNRRARAYRAQSAFLLRHSDLLIAAADPDDPGRAGGTMETVREALAYELPVVFLHTGTGDVHLIEPEEDLLSILAMPAPSPGDWQKTLDKWVTLLTADPDTGLDPNPGASDSSKIRGEPMLREYFDTPTQPPRDRRSGNKRTPTKREKFWTGFEKLFRRGPRPRGDDPLKPYDIYRNRATDLNYHYSGLYRGAFLLNYIFAVLAVALAALSLVLLGLATHTALGSQLATLAQSSGAPPVDVPHVATVPTRWLLPLLLVFAFVKGIILFYIFRNTRQANREEWNDRAVDYRYLAERLRGMYYLPLVGSQQPPAAAPPQFASRAVRQSYVDWLFEAIVRSISPADLAESRPATFPSHDGRGVVRVRKLLTWDPVEKLKLVRDRWIVEQTKYHEGNARTMRALYRISEGTGEILSRAVIFVVALDLVIVGAELLHRLPAGWGHGARLVTPWLIFVSAVLPAVVAAMNGIRFQSECRRLAERSGVMRVMLQGRVDAKVGDSRGRWELTERLVGRIENARRSPATDPGSWSLDVLRLTERVATDFVQEAAEWSVLYAKELSDPV